MKYVVLAIMLFVPLVTLAKDGESKADSIRVEYAVANDQPSMSDAQWVAVSSSETKEEVVEDIPLGRNFWIRASTKENPDQWVV
ncbi:hypothetical protein HMP0015_2739 [Acinetobacter haemolyticus ATCC 19194]|uniref:Uncharacterized protein n=1 Tax=Acinetobacter haemolyticus ATCC 19194 TaxID=707232 RepID=D4XSP7_ACIHA|nr:hypothetical protein [Acinetobacter haemolyticus]EFF81787.1 hypothetical protein HMP0015_2739 [Acinetobacter haemolyticus ATCC 19194]